MTDSKRKKRPRDLNQLAKSIVDIATNEQSDDEKSIHEAQRKGGRRGGRARADVLTPEQRSEIARKAAASRWKD